MNCCQGDVGNVDDDPGNVSDLADVLYLANAIFLSGPEVKCSWEANVDQSPDDVLDLGDVLGLASSLFLGGPALPPCPGQ